MKLIDGAVEFAECLACLRLANYLSGFGLKFLQCSVDIKANSAVLYFEAFGSFHPGLNSAGTKKSFYIFFILPPPPPTTKMASVKTGVKVT